MKSKIIRIFTLLLIINTILCIEGNTQSVDYNAIFENLNPANISTGILYDKSYPESDVLEFDGSSPTVTMSANEWYLIYRELLLAHVTSYTIPTLSEIHENMNEIYTGKQVPLCIVNLNYNNLKDNALDDTLLILVNDQLYDVVNPPESPYSTTRYFSALSFPSTFNSDNITYKFDPDLYISNTGETVQSIDIDFGNGYYYTGLNLNSSVTINYSNIGSTIELTLHLQGGTNLVSTFETEKNLLKSAEVCISDATISITNAYYNGKNYSGQCGVWFGCETTSLNDLKKPVIILEGWDPTDERNECNAYGEVDVNNFNSTLRNKGFDIIVLNYDRGGAEIQGNAMVLVNLIDTLRTIMEANDNYNEFVIMGVSMGGLVARYALAYMESVNIPHYTKLFLSMDSPQQGAYISYALQHLVHHVFDTLKDTEFMDVEEYAKLGKQFFCPASQQMLVYYRPDCQPDYPAPSPARTQLLNQFNNFGNNGYPTNVDKMVAFSFGSGDGDNQGFSAGATRFEYNASLGSGVNLHFLQRAIPNYSNLKIHELFVEKTVYNPCSGWPILNWFCGRTDSLTLPIVHYELEVSGTLPYEGSPGSYQNITFDFVDKLNSELGTNIVLNSNQDCFIPTVSALHLLNVPLGYNVHANLTNYSNYYEVNNPAITPFNAIYVEDVNRIHSRYGVTDSMINKAMDLIMVNNLELDNLTLNNEKVQYEAETSISLENITVQNNSTLYLRAGQTITFERNISIAAGCNFKAITQSFCQ